MAPRGLLSAPPRAGTSSYKILGMDMKEVALLFNTANSDDAALDAMVKRQYRAMALKCHPDKHSGASEQQQDYASAWIKLINEAAELIRSVERRNSAPSHLLLLDRALLLLGALEPLCAAPSNSLPSSPRRIEYARDA